MNSKKYQHLIILKFRHKISYISMHILFPICSSLRTSETNYLNEAFSFYSAIRMRAYYSKASKEDRPDLMVKKLRYYARFIVVCLLLKKMKLVRDLVRVGITWKLVIWYTYKWFSQFLVIKLEQSFNHWEWIYFLMCDISKSKAGHSITYI